MEIRVSVIKFFLTLYFSVGVAVHAEAAVSRSGQCQNILISLLSGGERQEIRTVLMPDSVSQAIPEMHFPRRPTHRGLRGFLRAQLYDQKYFFRWIHLKLRNSLGPIQDITYREFFNQLKSSLRYNFVVENTELCLVSRRRIPFAEDIMSKHVAISNYSPNVRVAGIAWREGQALHLSNDSGSYPVSYATFCSFAVALQHELQSPVFIHSYDQLRFSMIR